MKNNYSIAQRNAIVEANLWCIDSVIRQNRPLMRAARLEYDDVYQQLALRLIKAVAGYDPEKDMARLDLEQTARTMTGRLATTLVAPLWDVDREKAEGAVTAELEQDGVLAVLVRDEAGALFVGRGRDATAGAAAIEAVTPAKRNRKVPIPHDRVRYRTRHRIENLFGRVKDYTRITLRKDKTSRSYAGFVSLAFALVNMRLCP